MTLAPCIRHLRDYVAIPSLNPMERDDLPASLVGERRYAEHLREQLRGLGLDAELLGEGDRTSVVAEALATGGDRNAETLMVASHLDTVPVDGMEIDPFDPRVEGGRLYGRGSCDTKAGMAALLDALERVLARGTLRRNLILVGEADEELSSVGVVDVMAHLGRRRPSWVLATEPTELSCVTHHKGIALVRLSAQGRACHSSDPGAGRNAIVSLSRAVLALHGLAEELAGRPDPELGTPTLSVGRIGGGQAPNIVPDSAWLVADRRLVSGETAETAGREIEAALAGQQIEDVSVESCSAAKDPLATPRDHAAVRACQASLAAAGLPVGPAAVAFGTDAGAFARHGIPGVVLGPGSIAQAHTATEFVETRQVESMTEIFVRLLEGC